MIRILFLGDIVGEPGRRACMASLGRLREARAIDFVVVNGENAARGRGITPRITVDLLRAGAAVITTGDHIWDQREIVSFIPTEPRLLRPANYPSGTPGAGSISLDTAKGKVAVLNLQGRTHMLPHLENPFRCAEEEVARLQEETRVIFVDIHAETTSEKIAMGRFLDGRVAAVVGTHTHVQTADDEIFPGGTAYLTDAGMCGARVSALGRELGAVLSRFYSSMPARLPVAGGEIRLCGALIDVDETTGRALAIERVQESYQPLDSESDGTPRTAQGQSSDAPLPAPRP